ncbi:YMX7-like protein [Mya arenaria]|uniref:YMX7-like protein n=1 Tax=Mya arenaria TaxID=6604 RepID=A0ABY7E9Y1_MYAAR|nr:uncharacterized protein LOC128238759 [Mya arenaria]WAR06847.1 YMX7-like protein [Mya arenaria]
MEEQKTEPNTEQGTERVSTAREQTAAQGMDAGEPLGADSSAQKTASAGSEHCVVYKLCDKQERLVDAWTEMFKDYIEADKVEVYQGDIFYEGPAADAIVSPANSFGFMDGGIDMVYSRHFGWQMQERLQKKIREEFNGELLVGQATIIPTMEDLSIVDWSKYNCGEPIKYLISAPTMRVPATIADTVNPYLALRAVILAVNEFNQTAMEPIRSVLCPGLGTAVGLMPRDRCAYQMLQAYEAYVEGLRPELVAPTGLGQPFIHHDDMVQYGEKGEEKKAPPPKDKIVARTSTRPAKSDTKLTDPTKPTPTKPGTTESAFKDEASTPV